MQYGFDFGLWTRNLVCELVQREFGVTLSLASMPRTALRLRLDSPDFVTRIRWVVKDDDF